MVTFRRAQKSAAFLRMALAGPSGSGKTFTALLLATELAGDKGVAVIDTERGSASKYSDIFTFDVLELDTFHPNHYIEAIQAAQEAGYGALVIDSLSHAWNGTGGLLELHEAVVKRQKVANSYTAWAEITPIQNKLIAAITEAKLHVIATMRSKTEYVIESRDGKSAPRKVGMAPIQRDGMEYEFDVFAEMDAGNTMLVQKSRCPELSDATIGKPGKGVADQLKLWLRGTAGGSTPAPRVTTPVTTPEPAVPVETSEPTETPAAPVPEQESPHGPTGREWLYCYDLSHSMGWVKTESDWAAAVGKHGSPDAMEQALLAKINGDSALRRKFREWSASHPKTTEQDRAGEESQESEPEQSEQPEQPMSQLEMHAWEGLFKRHADLGGDQESWDVILRTAKGNLQIATSMVNTKEEFNLQTAPQFAGSKGNH